MDKLDFGLTLTLVGMGGTLVSLWLLTLAMLALKRLFPARPGQAAPERDGGGPA